MAYDEVTAQLVSENRVLQGRLHEAMALLERVAQYPENMTCNSLLRNDVRRFLAGTTGAPPSAALGSVEHGS